MKRLCLIRHAKSDWENEDLEDFERPLNARGYRDARDSALRLKSAGMIPHGMVSSTAIRASTTALIFARAFGLGHEQLRFRHDLYETGEKQYLNVIRNLDDKQDTVFLFGHNNTITQVANRLIAEKIEDIPTCGIVGLEFRTGSWKEAEGGILLFFDYPKKDKPRPPKSG